MCLLTIPAFPTIEGYQITPVNRSSYGISNVLLFRLRFERSENLALLLLALFQLMLHFGMQGKGYALLAVKIRYRYLVSIIQSDNAVQHLQSLLDGVLFDGVGGQRLHLLVPQVIDHVG